MLTMAKHGGVSEKHLVVTGDVTLDWNLARIQHATMPSRHWNPMDAVSVTPRYGGAVMLAEMISELATCATPPGPSWTTHAPRVPRADSPEAFAGFDHCYAMWVPEPKQSGEKRATHVWRVKEFLGLDRLEARAGASPPRVPRVGQSLPTADLIVIDDADLRFREARGAWPRAVVESQSSGWILLKMSGRIAQGSLWRHLVSYCTDRLVVVLDVNDLRLNEVQISRELSWERTTEDLLWELAHNPAINALSHCRHVVVSLGTSGVLLVSREAETGEGSRRCVLLFDPQALEGMWDESRPGRLIGYTTCLAASLAHGLMTDDKTGSLERSLQAGVAAMRHLHTEGYGPQSPTGSMHPPVFPAAELAKLIATGPRPLARTDAPITVGEESRASGSHRRRYWSIVGRKLGAAGVTGGGPDASLAEVSAQIVLQGAEGVLADVPLGRFGDLTTADRREIEGYRSARALIAGYGAGGDGKPVSLAVFGPPGAGKSFGVEQVAKSVTGLNVDTSCVFNLSQLAGPHELVDALHQVRDVGLKGKLPLVFWDEFDATLNWQALGWLRYFLATIQDGTFQDGQITHQIGRAIFVFAGGVYATMEEFAHGGEGNDAGFRTAKGPDFVSRLKGFINVLGPNPQGDSTADPGFLLRRALLLRSTLEKRAAQLVDRAEGGARLRIDRGVLRALLHIGQYKHGARSMRALVDMSSLAGRTHFERSCLPTREQLDLHVDGRQFLELMHQPDLSPSTLDELAEAVYGIHCASHPSLLGKNGRPRVPFHKLSEAAREGNRAQVRDYGHQLASIGYAIVPARSGDPVVAFSDDELRVLGELEHTRWMRGKQAAGYVWGATRCDGPGPLTNPSLLPWRKLRPDEQDGNKAFAIRMPANLAQAGYTCRRVAAVSLEQRLATCRAADTELRLAVAGHRVICEPDRLLAGIEAALTDLLSRHADPELVIYSPLAPGGVSLLTEALLDLTHGRLVVVLPMPLTEYESDFEPEEPRRTFRRLLNAASEVVTLEPTSTRRDAYRAADAFTVDQCDVLFALWDGQPAKGPGGTAESVARACAQPQTPVYHVWSGNRRAGTQEATSLGSQQGEVRVL